MAPAKDDGFKKLEYCDTVVGFDSKLKENGAELPDSFVRMLLTIIHAILPPPKPKPKSEKLESGKR